MEYGKARRILYDHPVEIKKNDKVLVAAVVPELDADREVYLDAVTGETSSKAFDLSYSSDGQFVPAWIYKSEKTDKLMPIDTITDYKILVPGKTEIVFDATGAFNHVKYASHLLQLADKYRYKLGNDLRVLRVTIVAAVLPKDHQPENTFISEFPFGELTIRFARFRISGDKLTDVPEESDVYNFVDSSLNKLARDLAED